MANMKVATHHPNGISNANTGSTFNQIGMLDPSKYIVYHDDFASHSDIILSTPTSHTVTTTGTGTRAFVQSPTDGAGGYIVLTNSSANGDTISIQHKSESFLYTANKDLAIKVKFKVSSATNAAFTIGLHQTSATPLSVANRIAFDKAAASTTCTCNLVAGGTATAVGTTTLADSTIVVLGLRYLPRLNKVEFLVNDAVVANTLILSNLSTSQTLTPTITIQNGTAAAQSMTLDYITCIQER